MQTIKIGNLNCEVTQLDGRKFIVTLKNVKYVPEICSNLFSLNKKLKNSFKFSNNDVIVNCERHKESCYFNFRSYYQDS
jgi:hypothetical protein